MLTEVVNLVRIYHPAIDNSFPAANTPAGRQSRQFTARTDDLLLETKEQQEDQFASVAF